MGCWYSRLEREEVVTRCKARRRYTKELVAARHAVAAAHTFYLRSIRSTGAALLHFADSLPHHHRQVHHHQTPTPVALPPRRPPAPPTLSPSSETYTSVTASPCLTPAAAAELGLLGPVRALVVAVADGGGVVGGHHHRLADGAGVVKDQGL